MTSAVPTLRCLVFLFTATAAVFIGGCRPGSSASASTTDKSAPIAVDIASLN